MQIVPATVEVSHDREEVPKGQEYAHQLPPEFRQEVLLLATKVGVAETAGELGIQPNLIYTWRRRG